MNNLRFSGLPTTPEQRIYFESIGLKYHGCFEKDGKVWTESWVRQCAEESDPEYLSINVNRIAEGDLSSIGMSHENGLVFDALFPERAMLAVGHEIERIVMRNKKVLDFGLDHVTPAEIMSTLRALSEKTPKAQHGFIYPGSIHGAAALIVHVSNAHFELACGTKGSSFNSSPGSVKMRRGDFSEVTCEGCRQALRRLAEAMEAK